MMEAPDQIQSEDDLSNIKPAFYYSKGGVPVFKPTFEQFKDFNKFVSAIDHYGAASGIGTNPRFLYNNHHLVKIIPPKEWRDNVKNIPQEKLDKIKITTAIRQHFGGSEGVYTCANIMTSKRMSLQDWKQLSDNDLHKTPITSQKSLLSGIDKSEKVVIKKRRVNDENSSEDQNEKSNVIELTTWQRPEQHQDDPDYLQDLEKCYWKNFTFISPYYAADIPGSLLDSELKEWNIAKLDNVLNRVGKKLPGVNTPYLYFGMWKSTFSWHVEDMDLYSINYIHFGAPKNWYVIPTKYHMQFKKFAQRQFPIDSKNCSEFLRHKTYMISPSVLAKNNIPVNKCVQMEGEIILTYPHGYHSGFNMGFNCAESVNFALPRWLEIGANAESCNCISDSVKIDVQQVFGVKSKKKKLISQSKEKICTLCGHKESSDPEDALLPISDSAKKFDGKLSHRSCALWIAETYTGYHDDVECVFGLSNIPKSRWKLKCKLCDFSGGAPIQCSMKSCVTAFHVQCALKNNFQTTSEIMKLPDVDTNELEDVEVPLCYCARHSPAAQKDKLLQIEKTQKLVEEKIDNALKSGKKLEFLCKWGCTRYKAELLQDFRDKKQCRIQFIDGYIKVVNYAEILFENVE